MREIKFRAWDGHKMYADVGVLPLSGEEKVMTSHYTMKYRPDQVELMQYTGLKDKNGVEIYESDILSIRNGVYGTAFYYRCAVDYLEAAFRLNPYAIYQDGNERDDISLVGGYEWQVSKDMEVIGNIYENPELLK